MKVTNDLIKTSKLNIPIIFLKKHVFLYENIMLYGIHVDQMHSNLTISFIHYELQRN